MNDFPRKRVALATLGCKVNQFESASFQSDLVDHDVEMVPFNQSADLYIINTCAVTARAAAQSRQLVRRALRNNPQARLVVTGCYVQIGSQEILDIVDQPLCLVGNGFKKDLVKIALAEDHCDLEMFMGDIRQRREISPIEVRRFGDRTRAFLKIQDGCDNFCTYCIVPFARGRSRSLSPDLVLRQVGIFATQMYREIVVTGIHTGMYGRDLSPVSGLVDLLGMLVSEYPLRYRISSLDPGEIHQDLLQFMAEEEMIMPHLHIPLQSGDNRILKQMNRHYQREDFAELIAQIREVLPEAAIGVDVMAGFPGEDEEAFENTLNLLSDLEVTYLHVFPYSRRPGTMAAEMDEQVLKKDKDQRVARLRELDRVKRKAFYASQLGRTREVLAEDSGRRKDSVLRGFTDNYVPVRFEADRDVANTVVKVKLETLAEDGVAGSLVR
ncbi:MAG: tRNA (N(6)-L-threonylcarbamoyladenosine(37)-C(2))-methylthiotransferase MtaB [Proteobacteria bacterium]|nr:tRNA (N(6)-L-threonylcarbamoyladenosine(37)-C(2))-methylthiotransferase MtaB [Pseudomonadota bacterium]MBU1686265.1 tRNA (N(6)-L-threonylcarbamoyladenosine(37)-C(2))-methylthiotransferase MtaB [Pseudomonadota bacterium]